MPATYPMQISDGNTHIFSYTNDKSTYTYRFKMWFINRHVLENLQIACIL